MPESTTETAQTPAAPDAAPAAPPWGEDFDPARAWSTITAQREAEKALRGELDAFRKAQKDAEDAKKSEATKLAERMAEQTAERDKVLRELWTMRAAVRFGIPDDLAEFLTGDSEEVVQERAKRLAEKIKSTAPPAVPSGRPKPRLAPGEAASVAEEFDPVAIANKARETYIY